MNHDIVEASHRELLAVLVEHRVDFVLVGGVGPQLKGYSGATRDVDVTIAVGAANETRLRAALEQLRAVPYLAGDRGMAYRTDLPFLQIPVFTILFLAPVYVPLDLLDGWIAAVAPYNPATAFLEAGPASSRASRRSAASRLRRPRRWSRCSASMRCGLRRAEASG